MSKRTIPSNYYTGHFLDLPDSSEGETWLVIRQDETLGQSDGRVLGVTVKTADLLAALDATANTDVAGMRRDLIVAENAADEWKARAEKAEAALDAVAASAREMRAAADRATDGRAKFAWNSAAGWIERNLDGTTFEPAFVLPTEAGAQFTAVHKASGHRETFTTITDGLTAYYLVPVAMTLWTVPQVMRDFTDHRLIGAES